MIRESCTFVKNDLMKKVFFILALFSISYWGCTTSQSVTSGQSIDNITDVSYNRHIKSIIVNNCITCHSGKFPSADMALDSYEKLVDAVKKRGVLKRINDHRKPMPTTGLMAKKDRMLIKKWVENSFALDSKTKGPEANNEKYSFHPPDLKAVDINEKGFDFFEKMQGHWVGDMYLLGQQLPWFAFDFRAINNAQLHGLFEGGSMGNLFNTFFVANYKGVKTIMLRNGGILSGIYRTSYFVLTEVKNGEYLFEDAYGGKQIMWVKITFKNDKMKMLTYTSKFGSQKPSRHMEFNGSRVNVDLANRAARKFSFPSQKIVESFPSGMPLPIWGSEYPIVTSASYIMQMDDTKDYITLGQMAQDPIQITAIDNIASLELKFKRTDLSKNKNISVYLSREPLTNSEGEMKMEYGFIDEKVMNQVILFPEIDSKENDFTLTYLHTGKCYITFVVDNNKDLIPSKGDFYSQSVLLDLKANQQEILIVDKINKKM